MNADNSPPFHLSNYPLVTQEIQCSSRRNRVNTLFTTPELLAKGHMVFDESAKVKCVTEDNAASVSVGSD